MGQFYQEKDFISGEQHRVCSQHFHGVKKKGSSDVPILLMLTAFSWCQKERQFRRAYFTSIASSVLTEKASKNVCHSNLQPKGRTLELENQKP